MPKIRDDQQRGEKGRLTAIHGLYKTPTYNSWYNMKSRCLNKNHTAYRWYGGKGVKVCDKWLTFDGFLEDMGERPEGTTLGRLGDKGNYEKSNCDWQTQEKQNETLKLPKGSEHYATKLTEHDVRVMRRAYEAGFCTQRELASEYNISKMTVWAILKHKTWRHV
jgi:hypothetical protein